MLKGKMSRVSLPYELFTKKPFTILFVQAFDVVERFIQFDLLDSQKDRTLLYCMSGPITMMYVDATKKRLGLSSFFPVSYCTACSVFM